MNLTPGSIALDTLHANRTVLDIEGHRNGDGFTVEFVKDCIVIGEAHFPVDMIHLTENGEVVQTFGFPGKCRIVALEGGGFRKV